MKKLYILPLLLLLVACQEDVELDLVDAPPAVVVEGLIRNNTEPMEVRLTYTTPFYQRGEAPAVPNAAVTITNGTDTWTLTDPDGDGTYSTPGDVTAPNNRTYTLRVETDGQVYEAESFMPTVTPILGLTSRFLSEEEETLAQEEGYYVTLLSDEPGDEKNFYYWRMYLDDSLFDDVDDILYTDDEFVNGSFITFELDPTIPRKGLVRLEQMAITEENFRFLDAFNLLVNANGNPFAPQPANPPTNVRNLTDPERYAFGFFGAASVSIDTVRVE